MRIFTRVAAFAAVIAAGAVLASCAPGPKPSHVVYRISTSPQLNPNEANKSSPVVVRFFELKSSGRFESADFFALFSDETATLGPTLVARKELQMWPSEKKRVTDELQPTTRMIGILAAYRNIERGQWRSVIAVEKGKTRFVDVVLGATGVTARAVKE